MNLCHFDLSETLNATTDCSSGETPVTAVDVTDN